MPQTFDIRFVKSSGFAALLEAPDNSFGWTGSGHLSVDPRGISVALKRGLLSLLARKRTRRIAAENLKEVFREGNSLRVEFATGEKARASLQFWADDRETAAQIVRLLPTTRTVELEHSAPRPRRLRSQKPLFAALFTIIAIAGTILWQRSRPPALAVVAPPTFEVPPVTVPLLPEVEATPPPAAEPVHVEGAESFIVEVPMPPLRMPQLPQQDVIPFERGTPAFRVARWQIKTFESEAAALWANYREERDQLASGKLAPWLFAEHLETLELRWWNVTFRILDSRELDAPDLLDLRANLLAAARNWRGFLDGYAKGLRDGDQLAIAASFDRLAIAEEQQARARQYAR